MTMTMTMTDDDQHRPSEPIVDVRQSISYLFEYEFAVTFLEAASLFDQFQKISTTSILHHHQ